MSELNTTKTNTEAIPEKISLWHDGISNWDGNRTGNAIRISKDLNQAEIDQLPKHLKDADIKRDIVAQINADYPQVSALVLAAPDLLASLEELLALLDEHLPRWYLRGHFNRASKAIEAAHENDYLVYPELAKGPEKWRCSYKLASCEPKKPCEGCKQDLADEGCYKCAHCGFYAPKGACEFCTRWNCPSNNPDCTKGRICCGDCASNAEYYAEVYKSKY